MARIALAPEVIDDLDRFIDYLRSFDIQDAPSRIAEIVQAIDILSHSPLIGRPAERGHRELIIGSNGRGYVALYRHVPDIDTVFVLAIRSQREASYSHRPR